MNWSEKLAAGIINASGKALRRAAESFADDMKAACEDVRQQYEEPPQKVVIDVKTVEDK